MVIRSTFKSQAFLKAKRIYARALFTLVAMKEARHQIIMMLGKRVNQGTLADGLLELLTTFT